MAHLAKSLRLSDRCLDNPMGCLHFRQPVDAVTFVFTFWMEDDGLTDDHAISGTSELVFGVDRVFIPVLAITENLATGVRLERMHV